jgi:hypothetical protein
MTVLLNEGIPIDICRYIRSMAKAFKAQWKQHRDAAQGLAQMNQGQYQDGGPTAVSLRESRKYREDRSASYFDHW